jgi:hypothetical protein
MPEIIAATTRGPGVNPQAESANDVRLLEDQHFVLPEDGHVFTDEARHVHI